MEETMPIDRFHPKLWALAERVWHELLTVHHPADEFCKLRDIEEIADAIAGWNPSPSKDNMT